VQSVLILENAFIANEFKNPSTVLHGFKTD